MKLLVYEQPQYEVIELQQLTQIMRVSVSDPWDENEEEEW